MAASAATSVTTLRMLIFPPPRTNEKLALLVDDAVRQRADALDRRFQAVAVLKKNAARHANAGRGPRGDNVSGPQRENLREVAHLLAHVPDHVRGAVLLHDLAIHRE